MEPGASRIERARLRAGSAKQALAIGSAAAFAVALLLARTSNPGRPGTSSPNGSDTVTSAESDEASDDGFDFGSGSIGPATGSVPQVQSGAS
jgi:hypothetical protein